MLGAPESNLIHSGQQKNVLEPEGETLNLEVVLVSSVETLVELVVRSQCLQTRPQCVRSI